MSPRPQHAHAVHATISSPLARRCIGLALLAVLVGCAPAEVAPALPPASAVPTAAPAANATVPAMPATPGATFAPPAAPTSTAALPRPAWIPTAAWAHAMDAAATAGKPEQLPYQIIDDGPAQGAPLGGIGAGTIGRTYRGDFARWHIEAGKHHYQSVAADQFSVYVAQNGERHAQVLSSARPNSLLHDWNFAATGGTYYALYPRAWYDYPAGALPVRLTQEQFSPVIPNNERETSYPVGIFVWRAENPTAAPMRVSLMFTWENLIGTSLVGSSQTPRDQRFTPRREGKLVGVEMGRERAFTGRPADGTLAIASREADGVTVSYRSRFAVDQSGAALWRDFADDGVLADSSAPITATQNAAALVATFDLAPGEVKNVPFALAWDLPAVTFPGGGSWFRHYTRFFDRDGGNAWQIAQTALHQYEDWRTQIAAWQQPILDDARSPVWYKTALFNELYDIADGGTLWVDPAQGTPTGVGQFAYLECFDYPYYATHDVSFYSSWAQLMLWPELERQELRDFAATVSQRDDSRVQISATGATTTRKLPGALPHDLGSPNEDPFIRPNAYNFQDINTWKDLNLKYVLRVYRDEIVLHDRALSTELWPTIPVALDYLKPFDTDGDGLLDHKGADQTYDTWPMTGASAYTGGLLIAALEAARAMANTQGDSAREQEYAAWLTRARASFEAKLWNGRYYRFNTGDPATRESIMADQLAGQWYAGATGLPAIAPQAHIASTLQTIYTNNVLKFADGQMGAVNGVRPDGSVDSSSDQAQEVWTGVSYALAALMLQQGMSDEGWRTAWGVYHTTYESGGFWFRTPEAWRADGSFRASMYMRPQSIWAIEYALRQR